MARTLRSRRRRLRAGGGAALLAALSTLLLSSPAEAASAPILGAMWSYEVQPTSARLRAEIQPNGAFTTYRFDYISTAAYEANLQAGAEAFRGASRVPPSNDANFGSLPAPPVVQLLFGLTAETSYRYRVVAHNSFGTQASGALELVTQPSPGPLLADGRGWELVSPVDKNGGEVAAPGSIAGGGLIQADIRGGGVAYASRASFAGGQGAASASQYVARRGSAGWATQNITAPLFAGSYDSAEGGTPYRLFSTDLNRALLLNGDRCRGEAGQCAVANPPLAGTDAPVGYQDYYLREGGAFSALLGNANAGFLDLAPSQFELRLAGQDPGLGHVVLESCAALSADAVEVPLGAGCDPTKQNLYRWSGAALVALNLLPAQSQSSPGAALAAPAGAVSEDGQRVYFTEGGTLYLREGSVTKEVAPAASFQTASGDGAIAYYTAAGHLYRYSSSGAGQSTDLTPAGGVVGVLGATADGATVYYQDGAALKRWSPGATATVASGSQAAAPGDYPPASGTARVAPGGQLLFASTESLTGYDNTDQKSGAADDQLFLYDPAATPPLICVSCNPTRERPLGPSTIPGGIANGKAAGSPIYKPRVLSADARRVFFDSEDALVGYDTNLTAAGHSAPDVYEWEAPGAGGCTRPGGCISLVSSGRDAGGAVFADASADGADAFFLTSASSGESSSRGFDLYDARVGGGFPEPPPPLACEGDACQPLPFAPADPTLDTLLTGPGNPAVRYPRLRCRKGFVVRKGECVRKRAKHKKGHPRKSHKRRGTR